jgi:hypothetical protein
MIETKVYTVEVTVRVELPANDSRAAVMEAQSIALGRHSGTIGLGVGLVFDRMPQLYGAVVIAERSI